MNLSDYQAKAHEFAIYPQNIAHQYVATKLAGECGELLNLLGKTLRGDFTVEKIRDKIAEELGGILWYVSEMFGLFGEEITANVQNISMTPEQVDILRTAWYIYNSASNIVQLEMSHTDHIRARNFIDYHAELAGMMAYIAIIGCAIGIPIAEIAERNIALLTSRKAAGTIQGHNRNE